MTIEQFSQQTYLYPILWYVGATIVAFIAAILFWQRGFASAEGKDTWPARDLEIYRRRGCFRCSSASLLHNKSVKSLFRLQEDRNRLFGSRDGSTHRGSCSA